MRSRTGLAAMLIPGLLACGMISRAAEPTPRPTATAAAMPVIAVSVLPPTPHPTATAAIRPTTTPALTATLPAIQATAQGYREETRGPVTLKKYTTTVTYFIGGESPEEIDWQMSLLGPRDALGGYAWYALTEPRFNWEYECACTDQGCRPPTVASVVDIRYTVPHWSEPGMEHDPLTAAWGAFESALVTHERGHGDLAVECGWQIGEAINALLPAATCADFDASVQAAVEPVFQSCRAAQKAYEDQTNHGYTQGVIWPP